MKQRPERLTLKPSQRVRACKRLRNLPLPNWTNSCLYCIGVCRNSVTGETQSQRILLTDVRTELPKIIYYGVVLNLSIVHTTYVLTLVVDAPVGLVYPIASILRPWRWNLTKDVTVPNPKWCGSSIYGLASRAIMSACWKSESPYAATAPE
jgi:hypothetical protein